MSLLALLCLTQVPVPDVTPPGAPIVYGLIALGMLIVGLVIALAITMPGTDSNDRAAVIRELAALFLGFIRELAALVRDLFGGGGPPRVV